MNLHELETLVYSVFRSERIQSIDQHDDGSISIRGDCYMRARVNALPFSMREVSGDFSCRGTVMNSLNGCPNSVGGWFDCSRMSNLTSLQGAPRRVGGNFLCSNSPLKSLRWSPKIVGGHFTCEHTDIKNLVGCPVTMNF